MKIDRATYDEVLSVAQSMREQDYAEFSAVSVTETREDLAKLLAERYGDRQDVLCARDSDGPICVGGTIETRPNVITLLFFATDRFPEIGVPMTRFIKNNLFPRYFQAGAHRIEAVSLASHHDAHRWLNLLGLKPETGPMQGYGKGGEAFIQFSMVRDVCSTGA